MDEAGKRKDKMVAQALFLLAVVIILSLFILSMFFGWVIHIYYPKYEWLSIPIATGVVVTSLYFYSKPQRNFRGRSIT